VDGTLTKQERKRNESITVLKKRGHDLFGSGVEKEAATGIL